MTQGVQRDQRGSAPDSTAMDQGMRVLSYLISGVLLYGALGWVGDHFLHTRFLLPIGIVLGAAFGIYTTIRRLSVTDLTTPPAGDPATTKEGDR
jgi:F0F1-type ATP synthase assembly protein I